MRTQKITKQLPTDILALILYLIVALLFFGTTGDYTHRYLGFGPDPTGYIWSLNWWPWAIARGLNPFVSHYIWYPQGFNMTWANSVPAAALLMFPLTWLANPVVSYNVLSLLSPALAAWVTFLLARYLTRDTTSSLIGGYLFGFSSYELGQMLGHLSLDVIFVVPLLVLLVMQRIMGYLSRLRFIAALAIALLVQLGLSIEVLATSCFFGAITWLIFLVFSAQGERQRLWLIAGEIMLASVIMAILAAPFLFFVLKGLAEVPSQINSPDEFSADLLNYLVPTEVTRLGSNFLVDMARRFPGNVSEQGAYLGLPLILILFFQFFDIRRRPYLKPLLFSLLVPLLFSLGPTLQVAGIRTGLWLPWRLGLHLPLIRHALPTRFSMFVALAAALAAALWLSESKRGWDRRARFTLAALACLILIPNPEMARWTPLSQEPFFQPQNVISALGRDANVIMLPYGETGPSMIWQMVSGMGFTQSGGYIGFLPPAERAWRILQNFYAGVGGPTFENDISAFCVTHQVSAILVGPGTPAPLAVAVDALHWPETNDHGVRIVHVPDPRVLHFYYISGDYWPQDGPESWMGRQIKVVTGARPMQLRMTGRMRPADLGPGEIRVDNGSEVSHYRIGQPDTQLLTLPANASFILTANATFVPARFIHNGDERHLSVAIDLQPM
jgi:hypothetical protein